MVATAAHAGVPLEPTAGQIRATELITRFITQYHYVRVPLDDDLSAKVLDRYVKSLDPNRSYFLDADIASFSVHRARLDDALSQSRLEPAFEIFDVYQRRVRDRVDYAQSLLEEAFDFTIDEQYVFDRAELPWPDTRAELDRIWRQRVKNDMLNLRLAGEEPGRIRQTLGNRYARLTERLEQFDAGDVYDLFINAYANTIEPHTAYFSPSASENFRIRMSLRLEGIGAALQTENEYTVVRRLIAGGPAEKSEQLHPDDRITGVAQGEDGDMVNVVGWRLQDVVDLIRGPEDSVVRLEVLGAGAMPGSAARTVKLVRSTIRLEEQAAKDQLIEDPPGHEGTKIGIIEVPAFYLDFAGRSRGDPDYRSTTRDVNRLIQELKTEGIDGLVVDLRGNGGGSLSEATALTGLFLESGPVVQVRDSAGNIDVNQDPDPGIAYEGPLVVLVDQQSASASEIFAGAIQDYRRGIIIGEPTFGKGTVQSLVDLDPYATEPEMHLGQLKLTTAQFFRVSGRSTQHRGVVPDIAYPSVEDRVLQGERSYDNALPWARVQAAIFDPVEIPDDAFQQVLSHHSARIADSPAHRFLRAEAEVQVEAEKARMLSLNEQQRRAERDRIEQQRIERENQLREALALGPAPAATDAAEAAALPDLQLDEAVQVAADLAAALGRPAPAMHAEAGQSPGMAIH